MHRKLTNTNRCVFVTATGKRCNMYRQKDKEYCLHHDPNRAAIRVKNAMKAGKAKVKRKYTKRKVNDMVSRFDILISNAVTQVVREIILGAKK